MIRLKKMPDSSLSSLIDQDYSSVYAYAGVEAIKARLVEQGAIVVLSEDDCFLGVLTPTDVLIRAHHLVIDCLRDKPTIQSDQTITAALDILLTSREPALPVLRDNGQLAGVLHQHRLVRHLAEENRRLKSASFR